MTIRRFRMPSSATSRAPISTDRSFEAPEFPAKMPDVRAITAALIFATGLSLDAGPVFRPAGEPDLKIGPTLAAQSAEPPILKRRLSNGLSVWIVEHHDVPIV